MLMITYGPQPDARGCVYTDTLITRAAYESGGPTDKVVELFKSAGLRPNELIKLKEKYERADELWGKVVYFRMGPRTLNTDTGDTLTYMERTQWMLASSRQRKKSNWKEIEPTIHEYPDVTIHTEEPVMPVAAVPDIRKETPVVEAKPKAPHPFEHETEFSTQLQRNRYREMILLLAEQPDLTGAEVSERMDWTSGIGFRTVWQKVRTVLGIQSNRSGEVIIDRESYVPACEALGVAPIEWSRIRRPREVNKDMTPGASIQLFPTPTSAPTRAPDTDKISVKPTDTKELKEIITLLREEMARQDMRRLVITPTEVEFTRVVTVEGKLEI
jgi:hypothetical protein